MSNEVDRLMQGLDDDDDEPNASTLPDDPVAAAIMLLTPIAQRGGDLGDLAAYILTTLAANAGGAEMLVRGRPGSWEADLVRQLVQGTVGDDLEALLPYRTAPVLLRLEAAEELWHAGHWDALNEEVAAVNARLGLDLTAAEEARLLELVDALEGFWDADEADYHARLLAAATEAARALGLPDTVPLEIPEATANLDDPLADLIAGLALQRSPLPGVSITVTQVHQAAARGQRPIDALREAGLSFSARLDA